MDANLDFDQLHKLLHTVFALKEEKSLTLFVDLPNGSLPDNEAWRDRRAIAAEWFHELKRNCSRTPFRDVNFATYENVGSNNNDLPPFVRIVDYPTPDTSLVEGRQVSLGDILSASSVVLSPTELSATAPLKLLAKKYGFRGATLPGFSRAMLPALALDFEKINARVMELKIRLDRAEAIAVTFVVSEERLDCRFDIRFRSAHASGGLMREPGVVGNLPSGEAYIVPYEGERPGVASQSEGLLPVQFENEIVRYNILGNKAKALLTAGKFSILQAQKLAAEPAYGNIAEVGFGVLGEWGVKAVGSTLLDEKLGLHVAFGRSDHFGGATGPSSFLDRKNVVHLDWVYVPSIQPLIEVREVRLAYPDGREEKLIVSGQYVV